MTHGDNQPVNGENRNYERDLKDKGAIPDFLRQPDRHRLIDFIRLYKIGYAEVLIRKGVDVNVRDEQNLTALHHAALRGMRSVIRELVKCGRCDYLAVDVKGRYAFELAITEAKDYAVARLLLKKQSNRRWKLALCHSTLKADNAKQERKSYLDLIAN